MLRLVAAAGLACAPSGDSGDVPSEALSSINADSLLAAIGVLASDAYLGRLPASTGEDSAVVFLERQFRSAGLGPGNPDGTYIQRVPLVSLTPDPRTALFVEGASGRRTLAFGPDVIAWTKHVADQASIDRSEIVFVGYGVQAPEYEWDDLKGVDLTGKTLVMLVNDPPAADPADPTTLDSTVFGGKAMTYYGRWTYKYEQGIKTKAAAVLVVHETGPAGYPWAVVQGMGGERFDLVTSDRNMGRSSIEGWITLDQAKALLAMAGQDFDALKARAATREFAPVPLGLTASMTIRNTVRTIDSRNVVARLEGADPALKNEHVIYMAHWDHLGVGTPVNGDSIYNGAIDNASGTAGLLEIARAYTALPTPPQRSVLFLAVTAEEQGLLGSQYYSVEPLYPLATSLAVINMDGLNLAGRTSNLVVIGLGASGLDDYAERAAGEQGRTLTADPEPEKGYYYRSDHFNFAKQGVPALYAEGGTMFIGKPEGYSERVRARYVAEDYHKPSDDMKQDWDLAGAVDDLRLLLTVGYRVANAATFPEWRPGSEFRAVREKSIGGSR